MGLFDFFIRKKSVKKTRARGLGAVDRRQIAGIQGQIDRINDCLEKHGKEIDENSALLKEHSQKLKNLEDIVTHQPVNPLLKQADDALRPAWATKSADLSPYPAAMQHNIESFSPQEKRILAIFFQNKDMAFSYIDIAKVLGKSANTVKNQMHQLSMKADLFEKTIDTQNRNRFKLKDGLKVEQYLNVS